MPAGGVGEAREMTLGHEKVKVPRREIGERRCPELKSRHATKAE